MRVTVRVFARLRELAGRDQWDCDVPPGASVGDVWHRVAADHRPLAPFGGVVSCAVNTSFASTRTLVQDGDEIAFLPPVSGG
jgi:molybdopterin converting factor subunit 1